MMIFGVAQLLFPTAFSRLDMRLHLWIYCRAPAIYLVIIPMWAPSRSRAWMALGSSLARAT